jgi:hypothetical protein
MENGGNVYEPFNFDTSYEEVVSFTFRPLCFQNPFDTRPGGPCTWPDRDGEKKNLSFAGNRNPVA